MKNLYFILCFFCIAPVLVVYKLFALVATPRKSFISFSQFFSIFPEVPGDCFRKVFYYITLNHCDINSTICFGTFFPVQNIDIGKSVYIGANCIIADSIISDDVVIGSGVHIISGGTTHNFNDISMPIRLQGGESVTVTIGKDSWIGNGSIIMADIGEKCIIGAGSVVTKKIEDYSIAVGNPARIIKKRC